MPKKNACRHFLETGAPGERRKFHVAPHSWLIIELEIPKYTDREIVKAFAGVENPGGFSASNSWPRVGLPVTVTGNGIRITDGGGGYYECVFKVRFSDLVPIESNSPVSHE